MNESDELPIRFLDLELGLIIYDGGKYPSLDVAQRAQGSERFSPFWKFGRYTCGPNSPASWLSVISFVTRFRIASVLVLAVMMVAGCWRTDTDTSLSNDEEAITEGREEILEQLKALNYIQ